MAVRSLVVEEEVRGRGKGGPVRLPECVCNRSSVKRGAKMDKYCLTMIERRRIAARPRENAQPSQPRITSKRPMANQGPRIQRRKVDSIL